MTGAVTLELNQEWHALFSLKWHLYFTMITIHTPWTYDDWLNQSQLKYFEQHYALYLIKHLKL